MKKAVKFIVIGLIAAAIAAYAIYTVNAPLAVKYATAVSKEAYIYFTETGSVQGGDVIRVFSAISGDVLNVAAEEGQDVHKGDLLAELDPRDYIALRNQCQANIKTIEANIETARDEEKLKKDGFKDAIADLESQLTTIEAQRASASAERLYTDTLGDQANLLELSVSQAELEREFWSDRLESVKILFDSGAATLRDVTDAEKQITDIDNRIAQYREQISAVKSEAGKTSQNRNQVNQSANRYYDSLAAQARQQIASLEENLNRDYSKATINYYQSMIDAQRDQIATIGQNIDRCRIYSPADGRVTEIGVKNLTYLSLQACAAVITENPDSLRVESYVSIKDVLHVNPGDAVTVTLKGRDSDSVFAGAVAEIEGRAEVKTSVLGIEEKRVKLLIDIVAPGAAGAPGTGGAGDVLSDDISLLKPGYDVEVRYTIYREPDKLMVPSSALYKIDGADYVFVVEEGTAVARQVETGVKTSVETVIESGLSDGDDIVAEANTEGLTDGKHVTEAAQ